MTIDYFDNYLRKHNFSPRIDKLPHKDFSIAVVIPCFNEPDIIATLESLYNCDGSTSPVEVIVVVNYPEGSEEAVVNNHQLAVISLNAWALNNNHNFFKCHIIDAPALPRKFAGVGLARKIGMDEAIHRFSMNGNEEGIICGFDADTTVDKNYLSVVEDHFHTFPKTPGASIYFEHPIEDITESKLRSGIIQYETHLRYLINAIRYTGFPYSFHTVGSSFAVKAKAYVKQGGMNKFKAGEDFYFINKIIPLGGYTEINSTRVKPQARISDRVPFGTGASMIKWMESNDPEFLTYQLASFLPLKQLFQNLEIVYKEKAIPENIVTDKVLCEFLKENESDKAIKEIIGNSSSLSTFTKRFFSWFDAFKIVKYLNFSSLNSYKKMPVYEEAEKLIGLYKKYKVISKEELLEIYRRWDRYGIENI